MVFDNYSDMTEEDIRKIVEGSAYDVELTEGFDSEGNISFNSIEIDGKCVAILQKRRPDTRTEGISTALNYGLLNDESYYVFSYGLFSTENTWYDKKSIEFMNLKTRDGVLAYLAENGFAEVESGIYYWMMPGQNGWFDGREIDSDGVLIHPLEEYVIESDAYYNCKGMQNITLYRSHKISETDDHVRAKVWDEIHEYSGAHLNYVNSVTFEFNTDGTIVSISWKVARYIITGEQID